MAIRPSLSILLVLAMLCILACGADKVRPTADSDAPPAAQDVVTAVTFETRTVERQKGPSTVSFAYPVIKAAPSEALKVALTREIGNFLAPPTGDAKQASTPEATADQFLADYQNERQADPDATPPWILSRKAEIAYQDPRVVSLRLSEEMSVSGPHGLSTVHYASFDPATGRRLGLAELFTSAGMARLTELGEHEFRKVSQIPFEQSLTEAGFSFENGAFALSDEIAVLAEGLVVYYNTYKIAPYAAGPTEIILPRSDLAPLAKPDGPLGPDMARVSAQ
ncbi:MAG TPA: DUF3298 domain-containing protein [Thermoanaerobaculia bacterium]|jgi:hypothetical protein|nr:DUF3298 domain-containing protein [Thermoanaerobaculia bacterium]